MDEQPTTMTLDEAMRVIEQLRQAVASHEVGGQATGVLVGRRGIDPEAAWSVLRRASQHHNIKTMRIASALVSLAAGAVDVTDPAAARVARQLLSASPEAGSLTDCSTSGTDTPKDHEVPLDY